MFLSRRFLLPVVAGLGAACSVAHGQKEVSSPSEHHAAYGQVKALLAAKCCSCHGVLKQQAELRLDTRNLMLKGEVIVPGQAAESLLIERVEDMGEDRMPPPEDGEALKPAEIALLRSWIDAGARAPTGEPVPQSPSEHWAFQRPRRTSLPGNAGNPVDIMLNDRQATRGLKAQPPAERSILIRRLYLDLTGLPPVPGQLDDARPWESIVDELLDSPQYGERWARHWMDVWRYSDWYGLGMEVRDSQKNLWRWRDWIVTSLNDNKGYDKMVREMLAGDEIAPNDQKVIAATGFLARSYYKFNRTTWLDNTIEHTGKAFMGLTLNCAKCHDHKYDPISHVDYYRFRAIFEPHQVRVDVMPGKLDLVKNGITRVYDGNPAAATYLHRRGEESQPDKSRNISAGPPSFLADAWEPPRPVELPLEAWRPDMQPFAQEGFITQTLTKITAAEARLEKLKFQKSAQDTKRAKSKNENSFSKPETRTNDRTPDKKAKAPVDEVPVITSGDIELEKAKLNLAKAEYEFAKSRIDADNAVYRKTGKGSAETAGRRQLEVKLARANVDLLDSKKDAAKAAATIRNLEADLKAGKFPEHKPLPLSQVSPVRTSNKDALPSSGGYPKTSSGRRTALANWLTHRDHPLTARVAVNHIWMRHFGTPLVETISDFGLRAPKPLHQDVLDYLAVEFIESGWDMKHLHRLMLLSKTWQRSSSNLAADRTTVSADPGNRHYWRMNSRRMEAQVVRDSLLYLSGTLDLTRGGPPITPSSGARRRSLYFFHSRDGRSKFLATFDDADVFACYRRSESIVPQQALAMMNSQTATAAVKQIAATFKQDMSSEAFVRAAFEKILGRRPVAAELAESLAFLKEQKKRDHFIHVMINHNDFLVIR
ncbi:MAG: PSD1 and planctomycete cytochrome C domain-containing protein [Fuerstiella sp.]|nr:PSD1 and planctomycete cytochrome C domain-containing protein [Fuerstiella sp.]